MGLVPPPDLTRTCSPTLGPRENFVETPTNSDLSRLISFIAAGAIDEKKDDSGPGKLSVAELTPTTLSNAFENQGILLSSGINDYRAVSKLECLELLFEAAIEVDASFHQQGKSHNHLSLKKINLTAESKESKIKCKILTDITANPSGTLESHLPATDIYAMTILLSDMLYDKLTHYVLRSMREGFLQDEDYRPQENDYALAQMTYLQNVFPAEELFTQFEDSFASYSFKKAGEWINKTLNSILPTTEQRRRIVECQAEINAIEIMYQHLQSVCQEMGKLKRHLAKLDQNAKDVLAHKELTPEKKALLAELNKITPSLTIENFKAVFTQTYNILTNKK